MRERLDPEAQVQLFSLNEHGEINAFLDWVQQMRRRHAGAEPQWLKVFGTVSAAEVDWSGRDNCGVTARLLDADTADCVLWLQCAEGQAADRLKAKVVEACSANWAARLASETALDGALAEGAVQDFGDSAVAAGGGQAQRWLSFRGRQGFGCPCAGETQNSRQPSRSSWPSPLRRSAVQETSMARGIATRL